MTDRHGLGAYLDHAASTPMLPRAARAVTRAWELHASPSSVHAAGRAARRLLEESREQVAEAFGADPMEVVFTSGGTEGDNLAVTGLYRAAVASEPARRRVLIGAVEHAAVSRSAEWLAAHESARVVVLPVDGVGRVHPEAVAAALAADGGPATVALVSLMWANNEVGTLQPVAEVAGLCAAADVPLHTDAVQAVGQVPVTLASGVSALTVSGHKFGGPPGSGAMVLRRDRRCLPLTHGGGQEGGVRSGTVDVAGAAGLAAALAEVTDDLPDRAARIARLRDALVADIGERVPEAVLNGDPAPQGRLPGNAHLSFPGCRGDALLMLLDAAGVRCSTGSACDAGVARASHVLAAMGLDDVYARSALRFSLGWTSTSDDVAAVVAALPDAVRRARAAASVGAAR